MKVKMVDSTVEPYFAYTAGHVYDVEAERAEAWIEHGQAVAATAADEDVELKAPVTRESKSQAKAETRGSKE